MNVRLLKPLGIVSLSFLIFTGCGMLPYRNDFQCQKGKNSGVCNSVSDVYELSSDMDDLRLRTLDEKSEEEIRESQEAEHKKALEQAKNEFKTQKLQEMAEAYEIRQIQNEHPVIFRFYLDDDKRENANSYLAAYDAENKATQTKKKATKPKKKANANTKKKATAKKQPAKQTNNGLLADSNASKETNSSLENYVNNYIAGLDGNNSKNGSDNNASYYAGKDLNASGFDKDLNSSLANNKDLNSSDNLQDLLNQAFAQGKASVDCGASGGKRTEINADVKVCVYAANIRQEPSCKAKVLRVANKGEVLKALYEQDGWIRLNDGTYIHKSIVTRD